MITRLRELGFQTTGWQERRIQQTILNAVATAASMFVQVAADTVKNAYNDTASGAGLDIYSEYRFDNTRAGGEKASGGMDFANSGSTPHVVQVGALIVEDATGQQFTNTTGGTIPASGSFELNMQALLVGSNGNVSNNSALTLVTPLAGVTVTNPGPGDVDLDGFDDPWHDVQTGSDPEPDPTLRERNAAKWGLLAVEKTATAYTNLALAQTNVTKARIVHNNPRGAGTVDVYVANGASTLGAGDMTAVQVAFAGYTFGTESAWPPVNSPAQSTVAIKTPATLELDVRGTVYYDPQYTSAEVQSNLTIALNDFVELFPIGGIEYISGDGILTLGDLLEVIEAVAGVRSVTLTVPSGDINLSDIQLLTAPSDWITGRLTLTAVTS